MPLNYLLFYGLLLFFLGLFGILILSKNLLYLLIASELLLLGVSVIFISFGVYSGNPEGFIMALLLLGIAAGEAAVGLSLLMLSFRYVEEFNVIEGLDNIKG